MVDVREIDGAIAKLESSELTMPRVEKLAALYTVKNNQRQAATPTQESRVRYYADAEPSKRKNEPESDFLRLVAEVDINEVLDVMDELMAALYISNQRVYNGVMRKLEKSR